MTELPAGFAPAWEWLRTEDGVIELEHEGGRIVREAMEAAMSDTTSHDEIVRQADTMQRAIDGLTGNFERCRKAGNDLAAAIAALPESDAKTALYSAYEKFMQQDAGNFAPPAPWVATADD